MQGVHGGRGAPVAAHVLAAPQQAQRDAGADVREDGEGDEEGLGERGLVDFARHEEVGFGGRDGALDGRDEGDVGEVEGREDGHGVAGVALQAGDCMLVGQLSFHLGITISRTRTVKDCATIAVASQAWRKRRA